MNRREQAVKQNLENQGYETIHAGIQDFVAVKDKCPHCAVCPYIKFVEVKSETDNLNLRQRRARAILQKHGFDAGVERVTEDGEKHYASQPSSAPERITPDHATRPDLTTLPQSNPPHPTPPQTMSRLAIPRQPDPVQSIQSTQSNPPHPMPPHIRSFQSIPDQIIPHQAKPAHFIVEEVK